MHSGKTIKDFDPSYLVKQTEVARILTESPELAMFLLSFRSDIQWCISSTVSLAKV